MILRKKGRKPSIDFDLRQLEIFCKVVELKSFSLAAKAVYLAQASVSERVATLEDLVGTRLLDRLGRTVVPTKAGQILYNHATKLLDMKRAVCLEMEDFLGIKRGDIKMGGSTIPGEYILPRLIGRFREKYPQISITLVVADSGEIESKVLDGELEIGIIGSKSADTALDLKEVWEDELVVLVPHNHEWAKRRTINIQDLFSQPFILREPGSGTLKILQYHLQSKGKDVDDLTVVARFGSSTAVKEAVKAGLGISVLSSRAVQTEIDARIIKAIRIRNFPMFRKFYLIHDKRRTLSPLCKVMLDFLTKNSDN